MLLITTKRHALNTAFSTFVFIGDFPSEISKWSTTPNLVLMNHAFITHNEGLVGPYTGRGDNPNLTNPYAVPGGSCENCRKQAARGQIDADFTPLTPMLCSYVLSGRKASDLVPENEAVLRSLDQEDVIPFLKRHLHWRIVRVSITAYMNSVVCLLMSLQSDSVEIHRDDVADFKAWVR